MEIEITKWRAMNEGSLVGFADVLIDGIVEVRGCAMRKGKEGSLWVAVPSRKYQDDTGKTKWVGHVGFPSDDSYSEFQQKSVKAITQQMNDETFGAEDDMPF
jgi:DNA-binding cell septation regulator SpoVG